MAQVRILDRRWRASISRSGPTASGRPSLPRAIAAKKRTRGLASSSRPISRSKALRLLRVAQHLGRLGAHLGVGVIEQRRQSTSHGLWRRPPRAVRAAWPSPQIAWIRASVISFDPATRASVCHACLAPARPARTAPPGGPACPGGPAAGPARRSAGRSIPSASSVLTSRTLRIVASRRVEHAVDPPLVRLVPPLDPVAEIKRTVGAEVDVGRQHRPDELLGIDQLERRPLGLRARRCGSRSDPLDPRKSTRKKWFWNCAGSRLTPGS